MKACWAVQSHSLLVVLVPNEPRGAREPEQSREGTFGCSQGWCAEQRGLAQKGGCCSDQLASAQEGHMVSVFKEGEIQLACFFSFEKLPDF